MKEITVLAIPENVGSVIAFVEDELVGMRAAPAAMLQVDVAVDEIFSNIAKYAYRDKKGKVTVTFESTGRRVAISFKDEGRPFNLLEVEEPDTSLPAEEREVGGLGILLVKKTMDNVKYSYRSGCNIVTIYKEIPEKGRTMEVTKRVGTGVLSVAIEGRLDTTTAPKLEEALKGEIEGADLVEFDLSELVYVSSAGLRIFLMIQKEMMAKGGEMKLLNMPKSIKNIFDVTGFSSIMKIT